MSPDIIWWHGMPVLGATGVLWAVAVAVAAGLLSWGGVALFIRTYEDPSPLTRAARRRTKRNP